MWDITQELRAALGGSWVSWHPWNRGIGDRPRSASGGYVQCLGQTGASGHRNKA